MKVFKIDLYEYFKVERPTGGRAELSCFVLENSKEINKNRKNPAMLVLPGGGYGFVSDREGEPVALSFVSKGFSAFVLTYSIAPIRFPHQLTEAVMAMNYIRLNAEELFINPEMVASVGFSAGGHLCGTLGMIPDCKEVESVFKSRVDAKPNAILLGYPVVTQGNKGHIGSFNNLCGEDKELRNRVDLLNCVDKNSAPAFIWSTFTDGCVPVRNSLLLAEAYDDVDVPFSIHVWGKGEHGLSVMNKTVYGKDCGGFGNLETATKTVALWIDLAVEWLEERGFCIE